MVADGARHDDPVARTQPAVAHDASGHGDARRVEHDAVDLAAAHHLRVAGDDARAASRHAAAIEAWIRSRSVAQEPLLENRRRTSARGPRSRPSSRGR